MVTGLEPSLFCASYSQAQYPYNEFVHSIPSCCSQPLQVYNNHYPSLQIVIEYPQLISHTFSKPYWTFSFTCKPIVYRRLTLCVLQSTSYSFASTISTCCSHGLGTMNATLLPTIYHVSVGAPSSWFIYRVR